MSYLWLKPSASPGEPANWNSNATNAGLPHWRALTPTIYYGERPVPPIGQGVETNYVWFDPAYYPYRNESYPLLGSWPPPQPGTDYDAWAAQQQLWCPYEAVASSQYNPETATCADVLGICMPTTSAQWLRFDWASHVDWSFVTAWTGVRISALVNKHPYLTNEGECSQRGPVRLRAGVYKHSDAWPATPATWVGANFEYQEVELNDLGCGPYVTSYGDGIARIDFDITTPPGGAWTVGDQAKYSVVIGQTLSLQGNGSGTNNSILGVRKVWAAAIATLGGAPALPASPDTCSVAVVG